jgi:hypothetical protein
MDGGIDGGMDAGPGGGTDAGADGGMDAGPSVGIDAGPDAGADAGLCAVPRFEQLTFAVGQQPVAVLPAAPIFGSGVLVANYLDGTVSRHRFDGGAWGQVSTFAVGPSPHGFAIADLNRDGRADLIVTNRDDAEITIRYQGSDAGFDPPVSVGVGPGPLWVAVGQLNGDPWPVTVQGCG